MRKLCWIMLLICVGLQSAWGNMRAPEHRPARAVTGVVEVAPEIVVLREELRFRFILDQSSAPPRPSRCEIEAIYFFEAEEAKELNLRFVTADADPGGVSWRLGEQKGTAPIVAVEVSPSDELKDEASTPVYEAQFVVTIPAGRSSLAVSYGQLAGYIEYDYGYFKKGRYIHGVFYELWPILEWNLAPDFAIEVSAVLPDANVGLIARMRGRDDVIDLQDEADQWHEPYEQGVERGQLNARWRFAGEEIPRRLHVMTGPADLMRRGAGWTRLQDFGW